MDVIQQMERVKTTTMAGHEDVPREPIIVEKVTIVDEKPVA
jgi:peptidyl-prolyl cis-trans isomerase B (cyclophilin B)